VQLRTQCPQCQKVLRCGTELAGLFTRCPKCQHKFRVVSLGSGGEASIDVEPSMEAMAILDRPPSKESGANQSAAGEHASKSPSDSVSPRSVSRGGQHRAQVAAQPSLGRFGSYDLKEVLGKGGFGVVYRAWDDSLGRQVAIKVPRFDMGAQRKVRRFRQEARAAAKLQHPNIVAVIAEGIERGRPYIVTEFIQGETLSKIIEKRRPPHKQGARWVRDLARALHYAHQQGIVHRDVKPDNVILDSEDRPRLMDFGLAKQLDEDSSLSIEGSVLGTPNYMAPEQARGEIDAVDGRSDQYSLGVVLYELLTREKPFSGPPYAVLAQVADPHHEPPTLRTVDPTIPRDLDAICQRAMAKDAADRYADMQAFAKDLDRWLEGKPTEARPLSPHEQVMRWCRRHPWQAISTVAVGVMAILIASLTWNLIQRDSSKPLAAATRGTVANEPATAEPVGIDSGGAALSVALSHVSDPPVTEQLASPPSATLRWQPTPEQQAFFNQVARLPAEKQSPAVARKLQESNPGFDGEFEHAIENGKVTDFGVSTVEISDIWPIRALQHLRSLRCEGPSDDGVKGKLVDLGPLQGMLLKTLSIHRNEVEDLSPLAGMPLSNLQISANNVRDLTRLAGMQLRFLHASSNPLSDLSPLRGMPLNRLVCTNCNVSDLSPISSIPLGWLGLNANPITSLAPLANLQLKELRCAHTYIADFRPLLGLPVHDLNISPLLFYASDEILCRRLPAVRWGTRWGDRYAAEEFWDLIAEQRDAAEQFATATSQLPSDEQIRQIEAKLHELNGTDGIKLSATKSGDVIESVALRLTEETADITPLRALKHLKNISIREGVNWLDLSPINCLPIEELTCHQNQALRNRLMLADIETLTTINGRPVAQYLDYLKSLCEPQANDIFTHPEPEQARFGPQLTLNDIHWRDLGSFKYKENSYAATDSGFAISLYAYRDFEFEFEVKLGVNAVSGVFYDVSTNVDSDATELLRGTRFALSRRTNEPLVNRDGAIHGIVAAQSKTRYNETDFVRCKIVRVGKRVQHWLNGDLVLDVDRASEEFRSAASHGKSSSLLSFRELPNSRICLYCEQGEVEFRNVRQRLILPEFIEGWISLNELDTSRWEVGLPSGEVIPVDKKSSSGWGLNHGLLINSCVPNRNHWLQTKSLFRDFVLFGEFWFPNSAKVAGAGIVIRSQGCTTDGSYPRGLEIELRDNPGGLLESGVLLTRDIPSILSDAQAAPDVSQGFSSIAPRVKSVPERAPDTFEIVCIADHVLVRINGVVVNECHGVLNEPGKIALRNNGACVFYSGLGIKPLGTSAIANSGDGSNEVIDELALMQVKGLVNTAPLQNGESIFSRRPNQVFSSDPPAFFNGWRFTQPGTLDSQVYEIEVNRAGHVYIIIGADNLPAADALISSLVASGWNDRRDLLFMLDSSRKVWFFLSKHFETGAAMIPATFQGARTAVLLPPAESIR